MAKLHNGMIFGRVGDLTFYQRKGVNYVRKYSKRQSKRPSEKQAAQREKFGIVMRFLSPIRGILDQSCRKINPKSSGLHTTAKQMLAETITGEYPAQQIDFSKVSLIRGNLARPNAGMTYRPKAGELCFWWPNVSAANGYSDDELMALIYCPGMVQWTEIHGIAKRYEQGCVTKLPVQLLGQEIHIWLAYRSLLDSFSDSVYLGKILTKKPQEHESIQ